MTKRNWLIVSLVLFCTLTLGAWAFGMFSPDPRVTAIKELRSKLESPEAKKMSRDERRKIHSEMRKQFEAMPEDQRRALMQEGRGQWQARMQKHMDEFFALPPDKQTAAIDKQIDEMEARRKRREQGRSGNQTAGKDNQRGRGWGGRRGSGGPQSENARNERRKRMMANTTPEQRAKFQAYRKLVENRRKQRGLPDGGGRWR